MNLDDLNKKRIMHIDTSCKLYENKDTGIAYRIVNSDLHRGLVLTKKLKRFLKRKLRIKDLAMIYSVSIYYLIKDELDKFDILIICGDEKFSKVKKYLNILFRNNQEYFNKEVISINELRILTGNRKLSSYADKIAGSYRKRGLKSLTKRQEGISLNMLRINLKMIVDKISEIKKCSGE